MFYNFEHKIHYLLKKEINELYITNALRSFALGMISIFIPIFLLTKEYSLLSVSLYVLINHLLAIFLSFFALKFVAKYGVKHSIYVSVPLQIFFFAIMYGFDKIHPLGSLFYLVLLSIITSLAASYYFMGFHVEFSKVSSAPVKQLSIVNILGTISGVLAPLLGSLIIEKLGFNSMFIVVIFILLVSIIPLFFSNERHESFKFSLKNLFKKGNNSFVYFAEGISDRATGIFWPIMLYLLFSNMVKMGGIYFVSNLLLLVTTYFVGKSQKNKKKILFIGTFLHSFSLFVRTAIKSFIGLVFVQGLGGLSIPLFRIPFQSIFYNNAKKKGIGNFVFLREFYLNLGRIFILLVLIILLIFLPEQLALIICIILGAVSVLFLGFNKDIN